MLPSCHSQVTVITCFSLVNHIYVNIQVGITTRNSNVSEIFSISDFGAKK